MHCSEVVMLPTERLKSSELRLHRQRHQTVKCDPSKHSWMMKENIFVERYKSAIITRTNRGQYEAIMWKKLAKHAGI